MNKTTFKKWIRIIGTILAFILIIIIHLYAIRLSPSDILSEGLL